MTRNAFPDNTDQAFQQDMLDRINSYRAKHGAPAVTLDPQLTEYAKSRAALASTEEGLSRGHAGLDERYGENLSWAASSGPDVGTAAAATASWYDEVKHYDFTSGESRDGGATGHFTQLVWKDCAKIGVGRAYGQAGEWWETYISAVFSPAGNMEGAYTSNVAPAQT